MKAPTSMPEIALPLIVLAVMELGCETPTSIPPSLFEIVHPAISSAPRDRENRAPAPGLSEIVLSSSVIALTLSPRMIVERVWLLMIEDPVIVTDPPR